MQATTERSTTSHRTLHHLKLLSVSLGCQPEEPSADINSLIPPHPSLPLHLDAFLNDATRPPHGSPPLPPLPPPPPP
eukprot:CAMPEP_0174911676 /NCGR_PEP_ID=MMETSP0167-20121228/77731_1 /TAXON_ID=38298 /ORGANISM="Rhodella maculata, Strain CCMP736" /LENGTH=76 /DNA_ID=CAMNT_0016156231 /DNA_START=230 /DNA_END=457 /DNA_ORIENTATION=+